MKPSVKVVVVISFFVFFGTMAWRGFDDPSTGVRISEVSTRGSYQRDFADAIESEYTLYRAALTTISDDMASEAVQRNILEQMNALQAVSWLVDSAQIRDSAWLPRFLSFATGNGNTPLAKGLFYSTLATWLQAEGALFSPDLVCVNHTTRADVDCLKLIGAPTQVIIQASRVGVKSEEAHEQGGRKGRKKKRERG